MKLCKIFNVILLIRNIILIDSYCGCNMKFDLHNGFFNTICLAFVQDLEEIKPFISKVEGL